MRVAVAARVERIGSSSFEMSFEVRSGDAVLANAVATLVWTDEELRSRPVPAEARARIEEFEGGPLPDTSGAARLQSS